MRHAESVRRLTTLLVRPLLLTALSITLSACGGGGSSSSGSTPTTYTVGGTLTGLASGASVSLLDNGGDALAVSASGSFTFKTALASGAAYAVTVGTQPTGQTCTVTGGSGTVASANVTAVTVSCATAAPTTFTIGGTVTGLAAGGSLALLNKGGDSLTLTANGPFVFATAVTNGATYAVTVGTQPAGQMCAVTSGSGTVAGANVTNVTVTCQATVASESLLYSFGPNGGPDGNGPDSLLQGSDGSLYGTTQAGGASNTGTVFSVTLSGTESILYSFGTSTVLVGYVPGSLIQGSDHNFYGITNSGGTYGTGIFFQLSGSTLAVLHNFGATDSTGNLDGSYPYGVIQASDGNFYGTTSAGAGAGGGVFKVTPTGVETMLHGVAGVGPLAGVIQASDGNLYGATATGGANSNGAVLKMTPASVESLLYSFGPTSASEGRMPAGPLVQGSDGNFYGLTSKGGANDTGTVYKVTPAGVETVLYSFGPPVNTIAPAPRGALIQGSDGNFYGVALHGGDLALGSLYRVSPSGAFSVVHSFAAALTDAANPVAVIQGTDGNLYGVATSGGAHSGGALFKITL